MKQLIEGFTSIVKKVLSATYVDEELVRSVLRDIQRALLRADVSAELVLKLCKAIERRVKEEEPPPGFSKRELLLRAIYEELIKVLGGEKKPSVLPSKRPYVMLLVGLEGSGKTTSAAKLALFYKRRGFRVGLISTDVYRPGAMDQLKQLGDKVGVPVFIDKNSKDPVDIARRGIEHFKKEGIDVIIVDTAGRHRKEEYLIAELREIYREIKPDEVMLVLDASIGKQAGAQARAFKEAAAIDSIFLAKLDGSARGGGALMAVVETGAKIKFVGLGEDVEDIEVFDPPRFVSRLLGMGDIVGLIERMKAVEEHMKLMEEISKAKKVTLLTFMKQLEAIMKMGPLRKVLELIPGFSLLPLGEEQMKIGEEKLRKWYAILKSMTLEELLNPEIINASRMRRIARGSGTTVRDVKELLQAYEIFKKVSKLGRRREKLLAKYFTKQFETGLDLGL